MFEEPLATDAPLATEEKGMSIPVIGSSECSFLLPVGQVNFLWVPVSFVILAHYWPWQFEGDGNLRSQIAWTLADKLYLTNQM